MRAACVSSIIARASSATGRDCASSITTGLVSEVSESLSGFRRRIPLFRLFPGGHLSSEVDSRVGQFVLQRRGFASVAAIDEEDDRPPSLRKLDLKKEKEKEEVVLRAFPRNHGGKIWCKKDRRLGFVPSILFEQANGHLGGNKRLISLERKQLDDLVNKIGRTFFLSRAYNLEIYDEPGGELQSKEKVVPRIMHHSADDELLNVTFMKAESYSKVKVEVPIVFLGEDSCPGIRKGGYVNTIMRAIPYLCPADAIPPFLEVDISMLDVGEKVLLKDLKVDPRLKLVRKDSSLPILKIMGTRTVEAAADTK